MDEIEETIKKIKDKGCEPVLGAISNPKDKARKLMDILPETSSMEFRSFQEIFKRLEQDYRNEFITDVI